MPGDLYAILGVKRDASKEDIKKAYRRLSKELHPDRNTGDKNSEQRFKEVNEAYEVLSDDRKRQMYDQFGTAGGPGGNAGGAGPFGGFDFSGFSNGEMGGFGDIFETFFGGARGGAGRAKSQKGRDIEVEADVDFSEVVSGAAKTFSIDREGACDTCGGNGAEPGTKSVPCRECGGTGQVTRATQSFFGTFRQTVACPTCEGARNVPERLCKTCKGEGRRRERKTVTVNIPPGVQDGQAVRMRGEGEAGFRGSSSGDLYVRVRIVPDRRFERDGNDVKSAVTVPVIDAILGAEIQIETVHGQVTLKVPAGTQPNQIFRLKGKGMPILNSSRLGDHYVTARVEVPSHLSREEKRVMEEWKKARG